MIYDISQEITTCAVFPGDPAPEVTALSRIKDGGVCNLSVFSMCAHNGTHIDAPRHFLDGGKAVDELPLDRFVGDCFLARREGDLSGEDAAAILRAAKSAGAGERILVAGRSTLTEEGAKVFAEAGILLYGNESQTVGPESAPMAVHKIMLGAEIVLLEGVVLRDLAEGRYFLNAAPLNFAGIDGAPCRAWVKTYTAKP